MSRKDIAIVGMACNFPGSKDILSFWNNLREGKELTRVYSDEELLDKGMSLSELSDPSLIKVGSGIEGKDSFDAAFFGYTRAEAELMDPQIRLFHEYTWKALDDAGCDPYSYRDKIGLFGGASENLNWTAYSFWQQSRNDIDPFFANTFSNNRFIHSLVSYKLDLRGPSYFADTACSTSLILVHLACRSLLMRECSMAVAGGVSIRTDKMTGYRYRPGMIYSADGHCRAFDSGASGTLPGEGIGVIVLKRLEDAIADKDHIYSIIRGSAVNNDGNRKAGFAAPGTSGQAECIRMAHKFAGIASEDISYVEAHGTGTRLGDPIEIDALNAAFGRLKTKSCAIGSVKTNMGHLDRAAGMAGLIKTVLALEHQEIPPSLHFSTSNPEIDFDSGPFYVNAALKKWERNHGKPLLAGVSSFGIGGTNAHIVLEEPPRYDTPAGDNPFSLLLLSAKTETSLQNSMAELDRHLCYTDKRVQDIAFTLQKRKKQYKWRNYAVKRAGDERLNFLSLPGKQDGSSPPLVVFLFSGQGSQYGNMGKDLYDHIPFFREIIDQGLGRIKAISGFDLREIWFSEGNGINRTLHAQPLLFLFEYALAALLIKMGIQPGYMIGHSIGELAAACTGGVFSFEDGISIVLKRAGAMDAMPEGAMLSIETGEADIMCFLKNGISLAAVNSARNCVVSGTYAAIAALSEELTREGVGFVRLKTSHAFHSAMIEPAMGDFSNAFAGISLCQTRIPYFSNVSGRLAGEEYLDSGYWADQMRHTVRFADSLLQLREQDNVLFLEVGPGTTLSNLCKRVCGDGGHRNHSVLNMIRHPRDAKEDQAIFLDRLGALWVKGFSLNWDILHEGYRRVAVPVPTYSFDICHWPTEIDAFELINKEFRQMEAVTRTEKDPSWFYLPAFRRSFLPDNRSRITAPKHFLVFSNESDVFTQLIKRLESGGHLTTVVVVDRTDMFFMEKCRTRLLQGDLPDQMVYPASATMADEAVMAGEDLFFLIELYKALQLYQPEGRTKISYISTDMSDVLATGDQGDPAQSIGLGLLKVACQEMPDFFTCGIDISGSGKPEDVAEQIYRELVHNEKDRFVCLRNGHRWVEQFEKVSLTPADAPTLRNKGTYLITGGLGRLGLCLAEYLLREYEANVILLGRTVLGEADRIGGASLAYSQLKKMKGAVRYCPMDISDAESLLACKQEVEGVFGRIHGIIHAAGNTDQRDFKPIENLGKAEVDCHLKPKVFGLLAIYNVFGRDCLDGRGGLDFVWLASSLSTVLGGLTFGAYVAANTFMDHFALSPAGRAINAISVSLDGLALEGGDDRHSANVITYEKMIRVFELSFQVLKAGRLIVSIADLEDRWDKYVNRPPISSGTDAADELPDPDKGARERPGAGIGFEAPVTGTEKRLASIWATLLDYSAIGVTDSFFELGGDSLKAMNLSRKIHREFGVEIPIDTFFVYPTVRHIAGEIDLIKNIEKIGRVNHSDIGGNDPAAKEIIL